MRISRFGRLTTGIAGLTVASLALVGCAADTATEEPEAELKDPIRVGMILSVTGNFATQATDFENGFKAGLDYLTDGTMVVDGHPVEIVIGDDTGDAAVGVSKAKEMIGEGINIIAGPTSSAVALAVAEIAVQNNVLYIGGTSGTHDLVGMSDLVFATSGSSPAGAQSTLRLLAGGTDYSVLEGKTLAYIGQDYAYGQAVLETYRTQLEPLGVEITPYLLPQNTTDFLPLALQLKQNPTDFLTSTWAGAGQDTLNATLGSQGIMQQTTFFGSLLLRQGFAAQAESLGEGINDAVFTVNYFEGMTGNEKDQHLQAYAEANNHVVEYDDAVGWHAAEMVFRAISEAGITDTAAMAAAIKDWSFEGPAGEVLIRGEDNQVTVPIALVKLVKQANGEWFPEAQEIWPANELEPPVVRPIGG